MWNVEELPHQLKGIYNYTRLKMIGLQYLTRNMTAINYMQTCTQRASLQVNYLSIRNYRSLQWTPIQQRTTIRYCELVRYWRKNWSTMEKHIRYL
jgi:hypothetical protein